MTEQNIKKLYRNRVGLEDLTTGTGTEVQTRNGQAVTISKINAANLPFDESATLQEVLTEKYPSINIVSGIHENVSTAAAIETEIIDVASASTAINNLAGSVGHRQIETEYFTLPVEEDSLYFNIQYVDGSAYGSLLFNGSISEIAEAINLRCTNTIISYGTSGSEYNIIVRDKSETEKSNVKSMYTSLSSQSYSTQKLWIEDIEYTKPIDVIVDLKEDIKVVANRDNEVVIVANRDSEVATVANDIGATPLTNIFIGSVTSPEFPLTTFGIVYYINGNKSTYTLDMSGKVIADVIPTLNNYFADLTFTTTYVSQGYLHQVYVTPTNNLYSHIGIVVDGVEETLYSTSNSDILSVSNALHKVVDVSGMLVEVANVSSISSEIDSIANDAELITDIKTAEENAISASASKNVSLDSEHNALASETNAYNLANEDEDTAVSNAVWTDGFGITYTTTDPIRYSAKHWSIKAGSSATASASSATASANSATEATNRYNDVVSYSDNALVNMQTAQEAAISASAAATQSNISAQEAEDGAELARDEAVDAKNIAVTASTDAVAAKDIIQSYSIPTEATYNIDNIDSKINALAPYNGYIGDKKPMIFKEDSNFTYKTAIDGDYFKINGKVVGTLGEELVTNGDFSDGTTGWTILDATLDTMSGSAVVSYSAYSQMLTKPFTGTSGTFKVSFNFKLNGGLGADYITLGGSSGNTTMAIVDGYNEVIISSTTPITKFQYVTYMSSGSSYTIDNISVREIKTIDMTDNIPEVTVQDQATNGLVVQSAVNAGDYVVVDKEELVTNGTFETVADGEVGHDNGDGKVDGYSVANGGYLSVVGNKLHWEATGAGALGQLDGLSSSVGVELVFSADITHISGDGYIIKPNNAITTSSIAKNHVGTTERVSFTFIGDSSFEIRWQENGGNNNTILEFDNISVQLASDVYRAERDTADMYDYAYTAGTTASAWEAGSIIKMSGFSTIPDGTFILRDLYLHGGATLAVDYDFTASSAWQDLGTAENMSLLNPYFKDRTQYGITNKILATMRDDGTIKTEVCFVDTDIEDCGNAHKVMTDNGYSKLENGLYSKNSDIVTPLGTWTVSNSGSFHEVYNYFGTYADINGDIGVRSPLLNSTADCFNVANIGTAIGHPQGIDKSKYVTSDQWIDLRTSANAVSEQDELNRVGTKAKSGQLDGIGSSISYPTIPYSGTCLEVEILDDTAQTVWELTRKATTVHQVLKSTDSGITWTSTSFTHQAIANTITTVSSDKIMVSYTAKIPTTQVTDPKAVKLVGNYVTATNSHSIYKGNQLVPTGKVNVGNGSNGFESRVVESASISDIVTFDNQSKGRLLKDFRIGTIFYASITGVHGSYPATVGHYYKLVNYDGQENVALDNQCYEYSTRYTDLGTSIDESDITEKGYLSTIPSHNTISLDNSNSPAVKFIETIAEDDDGMAHYQVFAQEMTYNESTSSYDGDDNQFTQLTNGTLTDDNANTVKTLCASIPLNKYIGDE